MNKHNLKVGQIVYLQNINMIGIKPFTIDKIGRKWFEVDRKRFDLETLQQEPTGFGYDYTDILYLSEDDFKYAIEHEQISRRIYRLISRGSVLNLLNLKELKIIENILSEKQ